MSPNIALRHDGLSWRMVEDEVVVLDLQASKFLSVNGSGSKLWELLARGSTRSELAAELIGSYGLEPDRASADVERFLTSLSSRGLLQDDPAPSGP